MLTILRKEEYRALSNVSLEGDILDLGGIAGASYHSIFQGSYRIVSANIDPKQGSEFVCDLEKELPIPDTQYDGVLLINVLEHIFEYRQLLGECSRILKPSGTLVVVVPFLFPYHPSPQDFHRYSKDALDRALTSAGFCEISIKALGTGVCAARWCMIERLVPRPLRFLSLFLVPWTRILDALLLWFSRTLGKHYRASDYALGFVVTASKK